MGVWCALRRAVKGADGNDLDAEELPEDIFAGLGGERGERAPEKPAPVSAFAAESHPLLCGAQ